MIIGLFSSLQSPGENYVFDDQLLKSHQYPTSTSEALGEGYIFFLNFHRFHLLMILQIHFKFELMIDIFQANLTN